MVRSLSRDFPGGPVVENLPSNAGNVGLIPDGGTRIPHAVGQLEKPSRCNYRSLNAVMKTQRRHTHTRKKKKGKKEKDHFPLKGWQGCNRTSQVAQLVKNLPAMWETWV